MTVFYKKGAYRIIIEPDESYDIDDILGDTFNPECNPDILRNVLKQKAIDYVRKIDNEGVHCAILQRWNPEIGTGWTTTDYIGGFVGDSFKGSGYDTEWIELIDKATK